MTYELTSAKALPLPDDSVDYVFADPPFGSNLFYADMALFQEGWLGAFTDHTLEAVIDRGARKKRDGDRYEQLLGAALRECARIAVAGTLAGGAADSPSHLYLELLRCGIADGWDLSELDLRLVTEAVRAQGLRIDPASGRLLQMVGAF